MLALNILAVPVSVLAMLGFTPFILTLLLNVVIPLTNNFLAIPTPPDTIRAPSVYTVASVVFDTNNLV